MERLYKPDSRSVHLDWGVFPGRRKGANPSLRPEAATTFPQPTPFTAQNHHRFSTGGSWGWNGLNPLISEVFAPRFAVSASSERSIGR